MTLRGQLSITYMVLVVALLAITIVGAMKLIDVTKKSMDVPLSTELDRTVSSFKKYLSKVYILSKSSRTMDVVDPLIDSLSRQGLQYSIYDKVQSAIAIDYTTFILRPTVPPLVYKPTGAVLSGGRVYKLVQGVEYIPLELKGSYTVSTTLKVEGGGVVKAGFGTQDVLVVIKDGYVCAFSIGYYDCKPFSAEEYQVSITKSKDSVQVQVYNELGSGVSFSIRKGEVQDLYLSLYVTFNNVQIVGGNVQKVYDESKYLWVGESMGNVPVAKGLKDGAVYIDGTSYVRFSMSTSCPSGWVEGYESYNNLKGGSSPKHTGHCYKYVSTPMTWTEAKAYCEQLGGYLFVPTSDQEISFIRNYITSATIWVGYYQDPDSLADNFGIPEGCPNPKDCWKMINAENEVPYYKWGSSEPNGAGACAVLNGNTLSDERCTKRYKFVCELPKPFPRHPKDSLTYVILIKPLEPSSNKQYVVGVPGCDGGVYISNNHVGMIGKWDRAECTGDGTKTYVDVYDGKWHVLVGVWQSKNQRMYVDGKYEEIKRYEYHPFWDYYVYIGAEPSTGSTSSPTFIIDELLLYHRALSNIEVQWITDVLLQKKFIAVYQDMGSNVRISEVYINAEDVEGDIDILTTKDLEELSKVLMSSKYIIYICDQYTTLPNLIKQYKIDVTYVPSAKIFGREYRDFYACTDGKNYVFVKNIYSSRVLFVPAKVIQDESVLPILLKMLYQS